MIDYAAPLHELPDPLPIERLDGPFDVSVPIPGSKSITNRAYMLAATADGVTAIDHPLRSDDCDALLDALATLGAGVQWNQAGNAVRITGVNGRFPHGGTVNLGDGGTPSRFMIAAACLGTEPVVVDGSARMRERPVAEGVEMLRALGATIDYIESDGRLPVRITPGAPLQGDHLTIGRTASSQFVSAVMLIAPWIDGGVRMSFDDHPTSEAYIHLTAWMLEKWGVRSAIRDTIRPGQMTPHITIRPCQVRHTGYRIEPDASSAAYWFTAAALVPGAQSHAELGLMASRQPDCQVPMALRLLGADLEMPGPNDAVLTGPTTLYGRMDLDAEAYPDGAMSLAMACARATGPSCIHGLHTLRVKETDRIAALAHELMALGIAVEATDDALTIDPSDAHDRPVVIDTYNDHRMAMAFAMLGLARGNIAIRDPGVVAKSYPSFWNHLSQVYEQARNSSGRTSTR
ncbi:MAG: 3-phosphoshikimate 1-carboxyvinyltransferase [Planctomycetota bacterium]